MSTFRNAIRNLEGKDGYFYFCGESTKATVSKIHDDLVELTLPPQQPARGYSKLVVHIDNLIILTQ